ncbi:MAG: glycoside hydrolase [Agathobacter sp.]
MKRGYWAKLLCLGLVLSLVGCSPEQTGPNTESESETTRDMGNATIITISPENMSTTNDGNFQGWGTSLCWWANRMGYSDELAQQAADLFYGEDGLRFNIMRYNIGGGDDPTHNHITRTDSEVPGWLVYNEGTGQFEYDYDADHNQLNVLIRAVKAAGNDAYVEVFSNSPPYFMTESGCSSGNTGAFFNNLKDEYVEAFAEYLAHVSAYINNELGIKVSSVSPMNEPSTGYWGAFSPKQEGCHVDKGQSQSAILVATAKAFEAAGLDQVEIVGSDETDPRDAVKAYNAYTEEALAVIDRISTHTYSYDDITVLGNLAKEKGFNLWMSEVDGDGVAGVNAGEMGAGLFIAKHIISDLLYLSPSAWVMWQVADNHISSEGYNGKQDSGMVDLSGGYWGATVVDHDKQKIIVTQKYYAIGQFTRYIRPGDTLISIDTNTLAAYNSEKKQLVIVAVNGTGEDTEHFFDLSAFAGIGTTAQQIRTSGSLEDGEHWALLEDIKMDKTGLFTTLKANSVTTFIIDNVTLE